MLKRYVIIKTQPIGDSSSLDMFEYRLENSYNTIDEIIKEGYVEEGFSMLSWKAVGDYIIVDQKSVIPAIYKVVIENLIREHREGRLGDLLDK